MSKVEAMSTSFHFDKEKYLRILKSEGITAALTTLHKDTTGWEYQSFEGEKGYQPEMWEALNQVREFSRELWDLSIHGDKPKSN
jgi:hypothetical protein